ncbi:MAG TPA: PAS-domain containing protein [Methylomirabilota bacterium]|nr:PAS-domain containing protein [Methylomirabilota bacterium]
MTSSRPPRRQPKATTPRKPARRRASTKQPTQALAGLTDALDCFGEAFVLWDADDRLVLCNRRYREIFAKSADAMVPGASFEEVLRCAVARGQYAETIADPEAWIQERLRRRREATGSFEIQLADGHWLQVSNRRTSDGGIVGILSDITERVKSEEHLRESETRLRSLMANMPGGIYRCRADWTEVVMSSGIEPITGYPPSSFVENREVSLGSLIHPEDQKHCHATVDRCIRSRSPYAIEYRIIHRSGRIHWVLDQGVPVYGDDGKLQWIDGVMFDITERKQMESEVQQLQKRMKDAIESIGEAFVLWDADEKLVICNDKYRELFDKDRSLLIPGRSLEEVIRANVANGRHPDAEADPEGWIRERLRRYRSATGEFEMKAPDGRWLQVTDRRTTEGGIVGIRTDITERKRSELELREANESLKAAMDKLASTEKLATIGQVAATVSHELRNPLGAIRNSMALVHQVTADKQLGLERALERVDRNIERCTTIITALLDFTQKREVTRTPTAIDAWLGEVLDGLEIPAEIAFGRDLRAVVEVAIDRERFRPVIVNLVENAAQALKDPAWEPAADHPRRLVVRSESAGPHVRLSITDTGPGIPAEVLPRIFEPLFTTKNFGVGLGLPTVRQIVELHGGTIDVESLPGSGTTFTVWLPRLGNAEPSSDAGAAAAA